MNILAVIPARGGSKGVPHKNIRMLGGKPLIAWTIEAANEIGDVMPFLPLVSTDDKAITNITWKYGATPIARPSELAGDNVPMLPVLQDAVKQMDGWFEDEMICDWVLCLQPTTPFRNADDIKTAIKLAEQGDCDSVISVVKVESHHPILMKRIEDGQLLDYCIHEHEGTRRQDYDPPAYMRNGAIYLTRRDVLMGGSIWGRVIKPYIMPEERSINIDSELDFMLAEAMLKERENGCY